MQYSMNVCLSMEIIPGALLTGNALAFTTHFLTCSTLFPIAASPENQGHVASRDEQTSSHISTLPYPIPRNPFWVRNNLLKVTSEFKQSCNSLTFSLLILSNSLSWATSFLFSSGRNRSGDLFIELLLPA